MNELSATSSSSIRNIEAREAKFFSFLPDTLSQINYVTNSQSASAFKFRKEIKPLKELIGAPSSKIRVWSYLAVMLRIFHRFKRNIHKSLFLLFLCLIRLSSAKFRHGIGASSVSHFKSRVQPLEHRNILSAVNSIDFTFPFLVVKVVKHLGFAVPGVPFCKEWSVKSPGQFALHPRNRVQFAEKERLNI